MKKAESFHETMRIQLPPGDFPVVEGAAIQELRGDAVSAGSETGGRVTHTALLKAIYDGVAITNGNGMIVEYNVRLLDLLRCGPAFLDGTAFVELVSGADQSLWSVIQRNQREGRYTLMEARMKRGDGTTFPSEIAVNRLETDGEPWLCFLVRDVTLRRQAQEALEDAVVRLETHDKARMQFVSNVSHELRTPLTSMIYALSNIQRGVVGTITEEVRRYVEMLDGDAKRLLATVNDILDLRKIEDDTLTLQRAKVPFARLVKRSVESLRVRAEQKSIALTVDTEIPGTFVDCDTQKMERVVLNVAGNALKFTPDGGRVSLAIVPDPHRADAIRLECTDTGVGIPPEDIARVTERYYTVGEQPSGSGLGLAITKEIVALHGGALRLQSPAPGQDGGTLVSVTLPRIEPPRIMIVDDEPAVCDVMRDQLTRAGYRAISAGGGAEALEAVRSDPPDGLILDLELPDVPGSEIILQVKSDKALRALPVIAVSGLAVDGALQQILKSFAVPLLVKPWTEEQLLDCLEQAFLGPEARLR